MYVSNTVMNRQTNMNFNARTPKLNKKAVSLAGAATIIGVVGKQINDMYEESRIRTAFFVNKDLKEKLDAKGIVDVSICQNSICAVTKYGANFNFVLPMNLDNTTARTAILSEMNVNTSDYGIKPYVNFVDDLRRFDIVKKGLGVKQTKLECVEYEDKIKAALDLKRFINKFVSPYELFCIKDQAYYYDKNSSTLYNVTITDKKLGERALKTCKFIRDEKGCAIGYEYTEQSFFSGRYETKRYVEQQEKARSLKGIAHYQDFKEYAEANRFGNVEDEYRYTNAKKIILEKLNKNGIKGISQDDIKVVWSEIDGKSRVTLNYYDSRYGISRVFDTKGQYIDYITYHFNSNGEIQYCSNARE